MDRSQIIQIFFYTFLIVLAIYTVLNFEHLHWDTFVAYGTIALAFLTWFLAKSETDESRRMRNLMIEEYKKERRRKRLSEQLREFYSPLMANISVLYGVPYKDEPDQVQWYTSQGIDPLMNSFSIKEKYHYLAEDKLRSVLMNYFDRGETSMIRDKENWLGVIERIGDTIQSDFLALSAEYSKLTEKIELTSRAKES